MNTTSNSFLSATQPLLYSSNKPLLNSSLQSNSNSLFKSNLHRSRISIRTSIKSASHTHGSRITSPEKNETLYELLGVSENVTPSEIKHAYKKMALKYHPDVSPPDRAEEYTVRFIRVREAYETLSDPEARSVYDRCMENGLNFGSLGMVQTRFDPSSRDKGRWKEMWMGQLSELMRRSQEIANRVDPTGGMSWAARIRVERGEPCVNGSDPDP